MRVTELQLKKYLLGDVDEKTGEEIGVRVIEDETLEEKLRIAENSLIEDFLEKSLSPAEEKLFYENFLISEERMDRLNDIRLFKDYSRKYFQAGRPEKKMADRPGFPERLKNLFNFNLRFAAAVLTVLVVAAAGIYFLIPGERLSALEREYAELNAGDFREPEKFTGLSRVELISGTLRSSDAVRKLPAENLSDRIFFRLALPFDAPGDNVFKAELSRDGETIFEQPAVRVYRNQSGQELRLLLPRSVLRKGRYQLKIENPADQTSPVIYDFAVE